MPKGPELDLPRLCTAITKARLVLQRFREERRDAVKQYVGSHWSEDGAVQDVPANFLSLYVSIVGRSLIAKNPRVMLSTFAREHKPTVSAMQSWCNKEIEHMRLSETLQRVVLDALFSIGICKVALATPADAALYSWNLSAGEPYAARVDLDDFVFDVHARDFSECCYIGHRYRAPLDSIKGSKLFGKLRKKLQPSDDTNYNAEGDERIGTMGKGFYALHDEYEDFVDLWEIYLPRHRVVLTLVDDNGAPSGEEALRVQRWIGPDCGPYHVLAYGIVPGNAMPKGPIQDLLDLHELANNLYRKLMNQGERQKELLLVAGGATEDGERVVKASDGEVITCDNPDKAVVRSFGGPNQQNFAMFEQTKLLFSWLAGNLDSMGGLSAQSKTATQDKMLEANSSKMVADMQDRTLANVSSVAKALCWYWHQDPYKQMKVKHPLTSVRGMEIARRPIGPQDRMQIPFEDLDIKVDPYSMQHSTPQSRFAALNQLVTQIVIPMMQLLQAQGKSFDINAYLLKASQYLDMPDLAEIVNIAEPVQPEGGESGARMPQTSERTYTRENVPGRTEKGDSMNRINSMMGIPTGGAQQNSQPSMNGAH